MQFLMKFLEVKDKLWYIRSPGDFWSAVVCNSIYDFFSAEACEAVNVSAAEWHLYANEEQKKTFEQSIKNI